MRESCCVVSLRIVLRRHVLSVKLIIYEYWKIKNVWQMYVSTKFDKHTNLFPDDSML